MRDTKIKTSSADEALTALTRLLARQAARAWPCRVTPRPRPTPPKLFPLIRKNCAMTNKDNDTPAESSPPVPTVNLPSLLTIKQVAVTLQVNTRTIRRWIEAGDLVTHQFGRGMRISEADLQSFIKLGRQV